MHTDQFPAATKCRTREWHNNGNSLKVRSFLFLFPRKRSIVRWQKLQWDTELLKKGVVTHHLTLLAQGL
jgi:hypothetical protein